MCKQTRRGRSGQDLPWLECLDPLGRREQRCLLILCFKSVSRLGLWLKVQIFSSIKNLVISFFFLSFFFFLSRCRSQQCLQDSFHPSLTQAATSLRGISQEAPEYLCPVGLIPVTLSSLLVAEKYCRASASLQLGSSAACYSSVRYWFLTWILHYANMQDAKWVAFFVPE